MVVVAVVLVNDVLWYLLCTFGLHVAVKESFRQ